MTVQPDGRPGRSRASDFSSVAATPVQSRTTTFGIRHLARNVSAVLADVVRAGRPAIVTRHGVPCVAIIPIARDEGTALTAAIEFLEDLAAADARAGRTRSASEVLAELVRFSEAMARAA
jgi:antitoxin (DNA-binding transcriptional repressor) of toxin-antitoxin stability system